MKNSWHVNSCVGVIKLPTRHNEDEKSVLDKSGFGDWSINVNGWLRNDINLLLEANNMEDISYICSKIMTLRKVDRFKNMSDKDILASIKPRLLQSPSEMDMYLTYLNDNIQNISKEVKEQIKEDSSKIQFNENAPTDENI